MARRTDATLLDRLRASPLPPTLRALKRRVQASRATGGTAASPPPSGHEILADLLARQTPTEARLLAMEVALGPLRRPPVALAGAEPGGEDLGAALARVLVGERDLPGLGVVPPGLVETDTAVGSLILPGFDRYIVPTLLEHGVWEPQEYELMQRRLEPGMTVVDIGAHIGFHALSASRAVGPLGRVVAFEASPPNHALLCANVFRNGADNVFPVPAAASRTAGTLDMTLSNENSGGNRAYRLDYVEPHIRVPAVAIDDVFPPDAPLDFVKVDIEGMDHVALAGMRATLARTRPVVITEFFPQWIRYLGDDPVGVAEDYGELGYEISPLDQADGVRTAGVWEPKDLVAKAESSEPGYVTVVLTPRA